MLYYALVLAACIGFVYPLLVWARLPLPGKIVHVLLELALLGAVIGYHSAR